MIYISLMKCVKELFKFEVKILTKDINCEKTLQFRHCNCDESSVYHCLGVNCVGPAS